MSRWRCTQPDRDDLLSGPACDTYARRQKPLGACRSRALLSPCWSYTLSGAVAVQEDRAEA